MTPRVWKWFDDYLRVHCSLEQKNHLMRLEGACLGAYDVIRPDGPKTYYVDLPKKHRSQVEIVLKSTPCGTTT